MLISIDGLAPRFVEEQVEAGLAPTFERLQRTALFTHNAHTELGLTLTIPNHTSMLTGLPVSPPAAMEKSIAHSVTINYDTGGIVHEFSKPVRYRPSIFDEVHDHGGCTAFHGGKDKLLMIARGYDAEHGRRDPIAPDNGRRKIDSLLLEVDTEKLLVGFKSTLLELADNCRGKKKFLFLHFRDTDTEGHTTGWGSSGYLAKLSFADRFIGEILQTVEASSALEDAVVLVTSDHGGVGIGHYEQTDPDVFRIPFYVWTPSGAAGDLYQRGEGRVDPGDTGPIFGEEARPIRNGDAANLSLYLMGMSPIQGSYHQGFSLSVR